MTDTPLRLFSDPTIGPQGPQGPPGPAGPQGPAGADGTGSGAGFAVVDAKGDLIAATAADTVARVPVGANGQVLTADSAQATGVAWAAVSGASGIPASTLTAKGDLLSATAASTVVRVPVGANTFVLTADSTVAAGVKWAAAPGSAGGIPATIVDVKGDLIAASAADTVVRVPVGGNGNLLSADSTAAGGVAWVDIGTPVIRNDFSAKGDTIAGTGPAAIAVVPVGTNGQVLTADSTLAAGVKWATPSGGSGIAATIVDAKGDIIAATAADTVARLGVGTNGQVLTADSTAATGLAWTSVTGSGIPASTATAKGDLLAATASATVTRLGVGTNNFVLTADSAQATGMKWAAAPSAAGGSYLAYPTGVDTANAADNRAIFQAALDAARDSGGGSVYAPGGDLRLDADLYIHSTTYLRCAGIGATRWMINHTGDGIMFSISNGMTNVTTDALPETVVGTSTAMGTLPDSYMTAKGGVPHGSADSAGASQSKGAWQCGLYDCTVEGSNTIRPVTSCGVGIYGMAYSMYNVRVERWKGGPAFAFEWSDNTGAFLQVTDADVRNLTTVDCGVPEDFVDVNGNQFGRYVTSARIRYTLDTANDVPASGTFTVTVAGQTTGAIAFNASAATVQTAVRALTSVGAGNALVSGSYLAGWNIVWIGALAGTSPTTTVTSSVVRTGGGTAAMVRPVNGHIGDGWYGVMDFQGVHDMRASGLWAGDTRGHIGIHAGPGAFALHIHDPHVFGTPSTSINGLPDDAGNIPATGTITARHRLPVISMYFEADVEGYGVEAEGGMVAGIVMMTNSIRLYGPKTYNVSPSETRTSLSLATTAGSKTATGTGFTNALQGQSFTPTALSGTTKIPPGTYIAKVNSATQLTLSQNAGTTGTSTVSVGMGTQHGYWWGSSGAASGIGSASEQAQSCVIVGGKSINEFGSTVHFAGPSGTGVNGDVAISGFNGGAVPCYSGTPPATGRWRIVCSGSATTPLDFDSNLTISGSGAVLLSTVTAKGDLYAATAAGAVSRLGVGSNTQVLTADSTTATGLKWAAAGGSPDLTPYATRNLIGARFTPYVTGDYTRPVANSGVTTLTLSATERNREHMIPQDLDETITLTNLAVQVTTLSVDGAGQTLRLFIRSDDGNLKPGALLIEAGTVSVATAGVQAASTGFPIVLTPGRYWFGMKYEYTTVPATTFPAVATVTINPVVHNTTVNGTARTFYGAGAAGAIPSAVPTLGISTVTPLVAGLVA